MNRKQTVFYIYFLLCCSLFSNMSAWCSETIEQKKHSLLSQSMNQNSMVFSVKDLNRKLKELRDELAIRYKEASQLYSEGASSQEFSILLDKVNSLRHSINELESEWRGTALQEERKDEEGYSFWDQEETTLSQLIMEFGAVDYLYIIPPEIFSMKLSLHSTLPIPRESWNELLEVILSQNGIGIQQINPFARQIYLLKQDLTAVQAIVSSPRDLLRLPAGSRVAYIFSPSPEHVKTVSYFFERFRDPKKTFIYQVGMKIAIVASKEEVDKLLSLYDTIWEKETEKVTKITPLSKITPQDMEKILKAFFGELADRARMPMGRGGDDLHILTLPQENALVLIGVSELVRKAEKIIQETEEQLKDPCEMTIYWYTCRHSDPIDLSDLLEKVYLSLISTGIDSDKVEVKKEEVHPSEVAVNVAPIGYGTPGAPLVVNPPVVTAVTASSQKQKSYTTNFIPDPKTGAIMMVIRRDTLDKIKELLKKLDVPKKMVQLEVLLFEKIIKNRNNFGLNVLKLGSAASGTHATGLQYESSPGIRDKGILQFFLSRAKSAHFPAFDIAYNFLMAQEDVRINASPSVTTVNQTPAQISIVEEISVNNGAAPLETNTGITFEKSFSRNQYGITIVMTPTVHEPDPDDTEQKRYITMETNVTFDTTYSDVDDRPKVNRRHIENQVRVLDGQTVILGGLRKKTGEDNTEKIPFLGEIPGIAKLFGTSRMRDELTEMIIFITPTIISDIKEDLEKFRMEELKKRPGDIPEFLERAIEARQKQKRALFKNSIQLLFGTNDSNFKY